MTVETRWENRLLGDHQPLTPDRVRNQEFSRSKIGQRGYSADEVRTFLYRVAEDMASGDREKADLRADVDRMRQWYKEHGINMNPADMVQLGGLSVDAVNILSRAQQTADAQIAEAEDYARQIIGQARQQYEQILQEAKQRAEEAAERAAGTYREGAAPQTADAEELERRIAYLRTFAEVTQVQLRAVLEGLAQEVGKLGSIPERGSLADRAQP
ncbi:DivIVA domain-containing protein [Microtetraspora sp. NBRC 16547]|uniref:DivIVA domain-containing protein n=1 Tax=Microtetraspora sp. NBRC 16547 TaxID=3030993 RepID=UPI0024A53879|nr:DivIVA domain-containing protein [Microtetraspora sp. NBRC 16547]GLX00393.1 hypothetical protein Misp02_44790 [Microtetraspora sp. NBRC 16547]